MKLIKTKRRNKIVSSIRRICDKNPELARRRAELIEQVQRTDLADLLDQKAHIIEPINTLVEEFLASEKLQLTESYKADYTLLLINLDDDEIRNS